ncbi:MAG: FecR family protein [Fuerstiella sp.]
MNSSRNEVRLLWCRQLSGERLNESESQLLRTALSEDSELRHELSDDATCHAILQSSEEVTRTEDVFVEAVMQQVTAETALVAADLTPPISAVRATPSLPGHDSPGFPLVADNRPRHSRSHSRSHVRTDGRRRRSLQWLSLVMTLTLFVSIGLIFWFQGQGQSPVAGTGLVPQERDVQPRPDMPFQGGQPDVAEGSHVAATGVVTPDDGKVSEDVDNAPVKIATNDNAPPLPTLEDHPGNSDGSEPLKMTEETPPTVVAQSFAMLTKVEAPIWERQDKVGARLGDGIVRLFGGTIELTFDDGAVVTLAGPVEFQVRSASLLELRQGQLSATVPKPAIGFTVVTPTSEVVDLGTEFDVSVKDTGASDVVIRKGEVEVSPGGRMGKDIQTWQLVPRGLNRASFFARPDNGQPGPIVAKVEGTRGQFQGMISLDGKTAKFRSEDTFNNVHQRMMTQFKMSQQDTRRQWQEFVDSLQGNMSGSMSFNGRQMQFGNFDEVMRLHNQLQNQFNANQADSFNGSININGKVIQFKTREEFEAARRKAFGPAANFGAGDLRDTRDGPK